MSTLARDLACALGPVWLAYDLPEGAGGRVGSSAGAGGRARVSTYCAGTGTTLLALTQLNPSGLARCPVGEIASLRVRRPVVGR